jgi:hypothetical protein
MLDRAMRAYGYQLDELMDADALVLGLAGLG